MARAEMHADMLSAALITFLGGQPDNPPSIREHDLAGTYSRSSDYLKSVAGFQRHETKAKALTAVLNRFPLDTKALDLGCCAGFTGLALRLNGWQNVDFADFEGLGLGFVRQFCAARGWESAIHTFVANGLMPNWPRYDLVLGFDVIEHTPNQLAFIEWLRRLGKCAAVTWPTVPWQPPLYQQIDTWIDTPAMLEVIERRFNVVEAWLEDSRQFVLFETGA